MKVRVEVTTEDIAAGVKGDGCLCPIARALTRATGRPTFINCVAARFGKTPDDAYNNGRYVTPLPRKAQYFAGDFDRGRVVEPFSFDLDIPDAAVTP